MAPGGRPRGGPTADLAVSRRLVLAGGALVLLACVCFLPSVWSSFVSDDYLLLNNMRHAGLGWAFSHNDVGEAGAAGHFYRPLWVLWNFWLFKAFGASATAYHVSNLVVYAVIAVEVWALAATFVDSTRAWIAAAAYAAYPRHGESVNWISGNTDIVAVAALLGALLVMRSRASFGVRLIGALALTAVATLSKEIAFTLPVLAVLVLQRERGRREWWIPAGMVLVEAAAVAGRWVVIGGLGGYSQYPWTPKRMLGTAASYTLASGLPPSVPAFRYWVIFLVPLALFGLAVWRVVVLWRRRAVADLRLAGIGVAWFFVALLPLLSLPVDLNNGNGERNLMLASVGLGLVLAALIPLPRRALGAAVAAGAVAVLAALSIYSSFDWIQAGKLSDRLLPVAERMAPPGGELILLSTPEEYRTAHVFIGGGLISQFLYRGDADKTVYFCAPVELRDLRAGTVRFEPSGGSYRGSTGWSAPFDFPALHSAAGLTGECGYSRAGGPERPGMGLSALATPSPSRKPVVLAYFDGHDIKPCC